MAESLLTLASLSKSFGVLHAVKGVELEVEKGSIISIIGPNGAGKTTVFNCISGIYEPTDGAILWKNRSIGGMAPDRIAHLGIARTYQNIRLFSHLSVLENVMLGQERLLRTTWLGAIFGTPRSRQESGEVLVRARDTLEYVGLLELEGRLANELSYGDQRRLEIARAIAGKPELLLLDEPTAGMNDSESRSAIGFFQQLRDDTGITLLLIEHDMRVVMDLSDRIAVLNYGEKLAEGLPEEIQTNPQVIEAYLGTSAEI